ncbi:LysE family transporter [Streptomyces sp. NPDC002055]|uniref:LysE family transporter n=1 Tax=Streptomyces sp. NPDC002055 TaxID=3154534 RepID=UPI0033331517
MHGSPPEGHAHVPGIGMTGSLLAGLWAGFGLAVPVGAVAVLMVSMTARTSFRHGAAAAMGAAAADACYALAAVLGGRGLASAVAPVAAPLRLLASAVLVCIAARIVLRALAARRQGAAANHRTPERARALTPWRAGLLFLGLTALNPWPAVYFVALVLGRQTPGVGDPGRTAVYLTGVVLASAGWQLLLAGSGRLLGGVLTDDRGRFVTAMVSGLLIVGLSVSVAFSG